MGRVAVYPLRRQRHSSFFRAQKMKMKTLLPNFRRELFLYQCLCRDDEDAVDDHDVIIVTA